MDAKRRRLRVSDSHASGTLGLGIWAYGLDSGTGGLWYDQPLNFANGLAMRPGKDAVYVCETFAPSITRIPFLPDGSAGAAEPFATQPISLFLVMRCSPPILGVGTSPSWLWILGRRLCGRKVHDLYRSDLGSSARLQCPSRNGTLRECGPRSTAHYMRQAAPGGLRKRTNH